MSNLAMASGASATDMLIERSWWKQPYVWMVIGGPLVVVVAAIFTAVIAFKNPDPVIDKNEYQARILSQAHAGKELSTAELAGLQPAGVGRNHAASPLVHSDTKK